MRRLTIEQARRIALAAQGFSAPRPAGRIDVRHMRRLIGHIGVLQLDSVNVLARSHYLPVFARIGPYPRGLLDEFAYERRELVEYWIHEASLTAMDDYPMLRHRMDAIRKRPWGRIRRLMEEHPEYLDQVFREVVDYGPVSVSDLQDPGKRTGPWWGYGRGKVALEWLFAIGKIAIATRRNFTRFYDLPERVIPANILSAPSLPGEETQRRMLVNAARWHGVGTLADLADYYRLNVPVVRPRLEELVAAGKLEEVRVEGWGRPAYMLPETRTPRRIRARAVLSPFDSVVWFRQRAERLFGFRYRIEIYVPQPKRRYGYYVLPFLLGDQLVGRVDLKSDRPAGVLRVRGAFSEDGGDPAFIARELAEELKSMAGWLGLGEVSVERNGDLSTELRKAV